MQFQTRQRQDKNKLGDRDDSDGSIEYRMCSCSDNSWCDWCCNAVRFLWRCKNGQTKPKKLHDLLVMATILKIMRIMEMRKKSFCYRYTFLILEVEEQDIQEIQKIDQQPETILLTKGDSEQQSVSIGTAVYFVYTTNQDKVLAVLVFDLPDKAVQYGCSEIEIVDNWKQYEVSQANAVLYSEETQEFQLLRCDTTNEYQLAISGISSAKGNTKSTSRMVVSFTVEQDKAQA